MNEHLPECSVEKMLRSGRTVASQTCICDALRACEERVLRRGLDAAREAVAAATTHRPPMWWATWLYGSTRARKACQYGWTWHSERALAAIDALKGDTNV